MNTSIRSLNQMNVKLQNTMKISALIILVLVMQSFAVTPAEAQIPAPKQSEPIALVGATIHTISGDVIENGTIIFEDGIITAIGSGIEIPSGTMVENVEGYHIYPGIIDSYSQMGIYEIGAVNMTLDINEQGPVNPNVMVERAFDPESRHIGIARSAGILTSITTPGGGLISGQSAAMKMDGWAWDVMTMKSGVSLLVNWPNPNNQSNYEEQLTFLRNTFADARAYMTAREAMEAGNSPRHDIDTRWQSMIPVFKGERPVLVNANEVRQIQDAITWAEEEDVRLIILGGRDAVLVTEHLKARDIPVVVTSVQGSPNRNWQGYDTVYNLPAQLSEAGVRFAISGSSSAPYAYRVPWEAGTAAAFGLDVDEAVKSITLYPAQIFGIDNYVGSLEVGKHATLMITTGNPIEYQTQIKQTYIHGRKSDMSDMQWQLYEKYREKVDQWKSERD